MATVFCCVCAMSAIDIDLYILVFCDGVEIVNLSCKAEVDMANTSAFWTA